MDVIRTYNAIQTELGTDETATALLVLASAVGRLKDADELAHAICMGIRMGLFGAGASNQESINSTISELAEAVREAK